MMVILADPAAPECCWATGLWAGMGMATRHPGVWRWREEPCDRALEINATSCHSGCRQSRGEELSHLLHKRSVGFLSDGDSRLRHQAQAAAHTPRCGERWAPPERSGHGISAMPAVLAAASANGIVRLQPASDAPRSIQQSVKSAVPCRP